MCDARLALLDAYLAAHLARHITVAELTALTGLPRTRLTAWFTAATGCTPHQYVLCHRLTRAQELLAQTTTPLSAIAALVGFRSRSHFGVAFRQAVGMSPGAYRWRSLTAVRAPLAGRDGGAPEPGGAPGNIPAAAPGAAPESRPAA